MTKAFRLHSYQSEILTCLREAWQTHRSVMVQMPTGTGKTVILAALVSKECGARSVKRGGASVIIVAHRRELVEQIEETVGRYGISIEDGRVRVMSIQWLSRHWEDVKEVPRWVIVDEAHHAVAETYREMWSRWPETRFLGLTATPCRMSRRGFTDLFDTLVCSWSIAEFIGKGHLSAFDYVSIRQGSEEQKLIDSLEKRGADGDYQIKEMNGVLNRRQSIERLYESIRRFADGRKGIVYAISIDHARRIAEYYSRQGMSAAAIDSRTPAVDRRRLVEEFRAGKIQVLVNVDIFSEGFDCPDVEFVQMARPTLSLAKYLQQVGRGLRRSEGKETCVLIDNVGLYRVFGLPTAAWDWEAMFRGEMAGKGMRTVRRGKRTDRADMAENKERECGMEVVVTHDSLPAAVGVRKEPQPGKFPEMKAWQDNACGLWGLCRGRRKTTEAVFVTVFDIRDGMAAVRFNSKECGVVDDTGEVIWKKDGCSSVMFAENHFLTVRKQGDRPEYIDLYSLRAYRKLPEVKRFGDVEMLRIGPIYYSRTKNIYVSKQNPGNGNIFHRGFYAAIFDYEASASLDAPDPYAACFSCGYVCLLGGDHDSYYRICRWLADGSIIVADGVGKFWHVADGSGKKYIGRCDSEEETETCTAVIERMAERAEETRRRADAEKSEKRLRLLERSGDAVPFRSGMKWGLKVGGRVTVPPVYRNIRPPVGRYCAVEKSYSLWGVVAVDGTVMVEPQYSDIEIGLKGDVTGTKITGKKVSVKLP